MNDRDFLEDLAAQLRDVGLSPNSAKAARLMRIARELDVVRTAEYLPQHQRIMGAAQEAVSQRDHLREEIALVCDKIGLALREGPRRRRRRRAAVA